MGLIGKKRYHQKRGRPRGALHIRMQRNRPLSPSSSWRYSLAGRPGGSISKGGRGQSSEPHKSIHPLPLPAGRQPLEGTTDDKATPIESDPSSRLVSSVRWKHRHGCKFLSSLAFHGNSLRCFSQFYYYWFISVVTCKPHSFFRYKL